MLGMGPWLWASSASLSASSFRVSESWQQYTARLRAAQVLAAKVTTHVFHIDQKKVLSSTVSAMGGRLEAIDKRSKSAINNSNSSTGTSSVGIDQDQAGQAETTVDEAEV